MITTANIIAAYLVIGTVLIGVVVHVGFNEPDCADITQSIRNEYNDLSTSRGAGFAAALMLVVIIICVLTWPYVLFGGKRS